MAVFKEMCVVLVSAVCVGGGDEGKWNHHWREIAHVLLSVTPSIKKVDRNSALFMSNTYET